MKKVLLSVAVVAFAASMVSCKKSYTCTCDLGILGEVSTDYNDIKKSDAEDLEAACTSSSVCTWSEQ